MEIEDDNEEGGELNRRNTTRDIENGKLNASASSSSFCSSSSLSCCSSPSSSSPPSSSSFSSPSSFFSPPFSNIDVIVVDDEPSDGTSIDSEGVEDEDDDSDLETQKPSLSSSSSSCSSSSTSSSSSSSSSSSYSSRSLCISKDRLRRSPPPPPLMMRFKEGVWIEVSFDATKALLPQVVDFGVECQNYYPLDSLFLFVPQGHSPYQQYEESTNYKMGSSSCCKGNSSSSSNRCGGRGGGGVFVSSTSSSFPEGTTTTSSPFLAQIDDYYEGGGDEVDGDEEPYNGLSYYPSSEETGEGGGTSGGCCVEEDNSLASSKFFLPIRNDPLTRVIQSLSERLTLQGIVADPRTYLRKEGGGENHYDMDDTFLDDDELYRVIGRKRSELFREGRGGGGAGVDGGGGAYFATGTGGEGSSNADDDASSSSETSSSSEGEFSDEENLAPEPLQAEWFVADDSRLVDMGEKGEGEVEEEGGSGDAQEEEEEQEDFAFFPAGWRRLRHKLTNEMVERFETLEARLDLFPDEVDAQMIRRCMYRWLKETFEQRSQKKLSEGEEESLLEVDWRELKRMVRCLRRMTNATRRKDIERFWCSELIQHNVTIFDMKEVLLFQRFKKGGLFAKNCLGPMKRLKAAVAKWMEDRQEDDASKGGGGTTGSLTKLRKRMKKMDMIMTAQKLVPEFNFVEIELLEYCSLFARRRNILKDIFNRNHQDVVVKQMEEIPALGSRKVAELLSEMFRKRYGKNWLIPPEYMEDVVKHYKAKQSQTPLSALQRRVSTNGSSYSGSSSINCNSGYTTISNSSDSNRCDSSNSDVSSNGDSCNSTSTINTNSGIYSSNSASTISNSSDSSSNAISSNCVSSNSGSTIISNSISSSSTISNSSISSSSTISSNSISSISSSSSSSISSNSIINSSNSDDFIDSHAEKTKKRLMSMADIMKSISPVYFPSSTTSLRSLSSLPTLSSFSSLSPFSSLSSLSSDLESMQSGEAVGRWVKFCEEGEGGGGEEMLGNEINVRNEENRAAGTDEERGGGSLLHQEEEDEGKRKRKHTWDDDDDDDDVIEIESFPNNNQPSGRGRDAFRMSSRNDRGEGEGGEEEDEENKYVSARSSTPRKEEEEHREMLGEATAEGYKLNDGNERSWSDDSEMRLKRKRSSTDGGDFVKRLQIENERNNTLSELSQESQRKELQRELLRRTGRERDYHFINFSTAVEKKKNEEVERRSDSTACCIPNGVCTQKAASPSKSYGELHVCRSFHEFPLKLPLRLLLRIRLPAPSLSSASPQSTLNGENATLDNNSNNSDNINSNNINDSSNSSSSGEVSSTSHFSAKNKKRKNRNSSSSYSKSFEIEVVLLLRDVTNFFHQDVDLLISPFPTPHPPLPALSPLPLRHRPSSSSHALAYDDSPPPPPPPPSHFSSLAEVVEILTQHYCRQSENEDDERERMMYDEVEEEMIECLPMTSRSDNNNNDNNNKGKRGGGDSPCFSNMNSVKKTKEKKKDRNMKESISLIDPHLHVIAWSSCRLPFYPHLSLYDLLLLLADSQQQKSSTFPLHHPPVLLPTSSSSSSMIWEKEGKRIFENVRGHDDSNSLVKSETEKDVSSFSCFSPLFEELSSFSSSRIFEGEWMHVRNFFERRRGGSSSSSVKERRGGSEVVETEGRREEEEDGKAEASVRRVDDQIGRKMMRCGKGSSGGVEGNGLSNAAERGEEEYVESGKDKDEFVGITFPVSLKSRGVYALSFHTKRREHQMWNDDTSQQSWRFSKCDDDCEELRKKREERAISEVNDEFRVNLRKSNNSRSSEDRIILKTSSHSNSQTINNNSTSTIRISSSSANSTTSGSSSSSSAYSTIKSSGSSTISGSSSADSTSSTISGSISMRNKEASEQFSHRKSPLFGPIVKNVGVLEMPRLITSPSFQRQQKRNEGLLEASENYHPLEEIEVIDLDDEDEEG